MKIKNLFVLALLVLTSISATKAQMQDGITIYNNSNTRVQFALSYDGLTWSEPFYLEAISGKDYPLNYKNVYIQLSTFNSSGQAVKQVTYQLSSPNRYQIYWNASETKWDLSQY